MKNPTRIERTEDAAGVFLIRSDYADAIPDDGWQSRVYDVSGAMKTVTAFAICLG